jgi:hypothetical protein
MGGTFLLLAGPRLYDSLGYGWGNTLLGFLALLFGIPSDLLVQVRRATAHKGGRVFFSWS